MRTTRHSLAGIIVTLALGAALAHAAPAKPTMKCWTNRDGVRECGNEVPPEYAQQQTRSMSKSGMTVEVKERAKPAQAAPAAEPVDPNEQRSRAEQEKNDEVLLATFTTEQDIIRARDRQVSALKDQVEYTRLNTEKLEVKVAGYKKRIDTLEHQGKPVPDNLRQDMGTLQKQIERKQAYMTDKRSEIEALQAKYDRDLLRFRELMQQRGN